MQKTSVRKNLFTGKRERVLSNDPVCAVTQGSNSSKVGMRQTVRGKSRLAVRVPQILKSKHDHLARKCGSFKGSKNRIAVDPNNIPTL